MSILKRVGILLLLVSLVLGFSVSGVFAVETINIKLAHILAPNHSWNEGAKKFAEIVESRSDGRINIEIFSSASLGDEVEIMEGMQLDTIQMGIISTAKSVNFVPALGLTDIPFVFRDWDHVHKVLDGEVGQELNRLILEATGLRALTWFDQGFRHIITIKQPVKTMADFKGLKLRTPDSQTYTKTFQALGASPTPIAFSELFSALETGVVDGFEGSFETVYTSNMYEVTKYTSLSNHIWSGAQVLIKDSFYQNLPSDLKKIIDEAIIEARDYERNIVIDRDEENLQNLINAGMIIDDTLMNNEHDKMVQAVEGYVNDFAKKADVEYLLEKIRTTN